MLPLIDAFDTARKRPKDLTAQGMIYPVTILLPFALVVAALLTRNSRFRVSSLPASS